MFKKQWLYEPIVFVPIFLLKKPKLPKVYELEFLVVMDVRERSLAQEYDTPGRTKWVRLLFLFALGVVLESHKDTSHSIIFCRDSHE